MLRVLALAVLITVLAPGVARGAPWRWPVGGRVVRSFSVTPGDPYAPGQRRGITLAVRAGTVVHAACGGRVAFAGSVGRSGPTLSVGCGALRATYQGLAVVGIGKGMHVRAGEAVGRVGAGGLLRLGARVESARTAPAAHAGWPARYVDPGTLLPGFRGSPPPDPAVPRARRPVGVPARPRAKAPPALPDPARTPLLAWLGLAVIACAAPLGALGTRGRRRLRADRRARSAAPAAR